MRKGERKSKQKERHVKRRDEKRIHKERKGEK
jgi:hypothetical protein